MAAAHDVRDNAGRVAGGRRACSTVSGSVGPLVLVLAARCWRPRHPEPSVLLGLKGRPGALEQRCEHVVLLLLGPLVPLHQQLGENSMIHEACRSRSPVMCETG